MDCGYTGGQMSNVNLSPVYLPQLEKLGFHESGWRRVAHLLFLLWGDGDGV